jgi:hypothetical protein
LECVLSEMNKLANGNPPSAIAYYTLPASAGDTAHVLSIHSSSHCQLTLVDAYMPSLGRPPDEDEEDALWSVAGDSWGAVLRRTADGAALAGASVLVFGADHARLQVGAVTCFWPSLL